MLSAPESSSRAFRKGYNNINEGNKELLKLTRDPHRLKTLLLSSEIDEKLPSTIKSMRTVDKLWITIFQYCFAKCCSLLKQDDRNLQFIFRCCGKATVVKQLLCHGFVTVTGFTFHLSLKKTVNAYDMPNDLIINIDKAPLLFVLMCKCAMYKTNKKFVPIRNNSDNYQITGTFPDSLGLFQIIYLDKASHCFTKFSFWSEFNERDSKKLLILQRQTIESGELYFISYVIKAGKGLALDLAN